MRDHGEVTATRDDVVARVLADGDAVDEAIALLDAAEARALVPLVDEAERVRLESLAASADGRTEHWHPVLASCDGTAVGYAGIVLPGAPGLDAIGDLAVATHGADRRSVLAVLLASLEGLAWGHQAGHLQVWLRHADADDVTCATDEGYGVDRQLAVLGRSLPTGDAAPAAPDGVRVRASRAGEDDTAIAAVLAATYAGTPEAGWDVARVRDRAALPWYRPQDVLLAEDDTGRLLGLHWLKRRSAAVGEVYNLAVHPDGQGRGLGAVLLHAGLAHLTEVGCNEVVLWVDRANERAVRLYTSQGFATRWEDVAFGRTLRGRGPRATRDAG